MQTQQSQSVQHLAYGSLTGHVTLLQTIGLPSDIGRDTNGPRMAGELKPDSSTAIDQKEPAKKSTIVILDTRQPSHPPSPAVPFPSTPSVHTAPISPPVPVLSTPPASTLPPLPDSVHPMAPTQATQSAQPPVFPALSAPATIARDESQEGRSTPTPPSASPFPTLTTPGSSSTTPTSASERPSLSQSVTPPSVPPALTVPSPPGDVPSAPALNRSDTDLPARSPSPAGKESPQVDAVKDLFSQQPSSSVSQSERKPELGLVTPKGEGVKELFSPQPSPSVPQAVLQSEPLLPISEVAEVKELLPPQPSPSLPATLEAPTPKTDSMQEQLKEPLIAASSSDQTAPSPQPLLSPPSVQALANTKHHLLEGIHIPIPQDAKPHEVSQAYTETEKPLGDYVEGEKERVVEVRRVWEERLDGGEWQVVKEEQSLVTKRLDL